MPTLANPKHERFACELAKGKSASEAYRIAGYKKNDGNAIRLKGNEKVGARILELQERAAIKTERALSDVLTDLERLARKAEHLDSASGFNVAAACHMDYAKLRGWNIERKEIGGPGDFDRMSDDELADFVRRESGVVDKELH